MNKNWKNFLSSQHAQVANNGEINFSSASDEGNHVVYPIVKLAIIAVTGNDAATFLQGQVTCNINEITATQGSFGAFCTPKGRAISTFFIIKHDPSFLLILPAELLEKVIKKLQLYILRADVQLENSQDALCLFGLMCANTQETTLNLPADQGSALCTDGLLCIKFPAAHPRYLVVAAPQSAIEFWRDATENKGFHPEGSDKWSYLDLISGIPWLNSETTETFTPQMINLDQLGGISFNKGCYTGQEVVARTHYLGKAKRQMYLAECSPTETLADDLTIIDHATDQKPTVGNVLMFSQLYPQVKMLLVLQISNAASNDLRLDNPNQDKIHITGLSYVI